MPRTGTGPFPAQRSSFPSPAGRYGFMAPRESGFELGPLRRVLWLRQERPVRPRRPGQLLRSGRGASPGICRPGDALTRDGIARDDTAQDDTAQEDLAQDDPDRSPRGCFRPGWIWAPCPAPSVRPAARPAGAHRVGQGGRRQRGTDRLGTDDQRTACVHRPGRGTAGLRRGGAAVAPRAPDGVGPAAGAGGDLGRQPGPADAGPDRPGQRDRPRPFNGAAGQPPLGLLLPGRQPSGTAPDARAAKVVWALIVPGA